MSNRIIPLAVLLITLIHFVIGKIYKKGNIKTYYFTAWFVDMIFSICGVMLSFSLFHYTPLAIINLNYGMVLLGLVVLTVVLIAILPGGFWAHLNKKKEKEDSIVTQYMINESFGIIRNCLYFGFVIFLSENEMIHAGCCILSFIILFPISIRQTWYWLFHMSSKVDEKEKELILLYKRKIYYKRKNIRI